MVAVERDGGGEEKPNVEDEEDHDWEVKVETQGSVLQETLGCSHCRSGYCRRVCSVRCGVSEIQGQQDCSEESSQSPAQQ